jgi:prepilin-type processing-associated H-X9-DG protein
MDDQKETSTQPPKPRTSKLAIIASVMVLVCIIAWIFWPKQALLITIYLIALLAVGSFFSMMRRKGIVCPPPVIGFLLPILAILLAILMPAINKTHKIAQRLVCGVNIKGLACALTVYTNEYKGQFPPADQWSDLLEIESNISLKSLFCPNSDAIEGESTYAININAAGKKQGLLPGDMVLLFETEAGIDSNGRTETIQDRAFFQFFQKQGDNWLNSIKNNKVYPNRWNQSGGPEILSMLYHKGEGCNVLFADGHSEYVPSNEIPHLRWTADANSMN